MKEACDLEAIEEAEEFAMAPVQLASSMGSATCGYKTEEVELEGALKLMEMHRQMAHPHQVQTPYHLTGLDGEDSEAEVGVEGLLRG